MMTSSETDKHAQGLAYARERSANAEEERRTSPAAVRRRRRGDRLAIAFAVAGLFMFPAIASEALSVYMKSADRKAWVLANGMGDPPADHKFNGDVHALVTGGITALSFAFLGAMDEKTCDLAARENLRAALVANHDTLFFFRDATKPVAYGTTNAAEVIARHANGVDLGPVFQTCRSLEIQAGPFSRFLDADTRWMRRQIANRTSIDFSEPNARSAEAPSN